MAESQPHMRVQVDMPPDFEERIREKIVRAMREVLTTMLGRLPLEFPDPAYPRRNCRTDVSHIKSFLRPFRRTPAGALRYAADDLEGAALFEVQRDDGSFGPKPRGEMSLTDVASWLRRCADQCDREAGGPHDH